MELYKKVKLIKLKPNMESIKTYLLALFLSIFFSAPIFSQSNSVKHPEKKIKVETIDDKTDSILVNTYFTEQDYNEQHDIELIYSEESEFYYGDEIYQNDNHPRRSQGDFWGEIAAEVVVEVVVNAVFIIATIWQ